MATKEIVGSAGIWLDAYALHLGANVINVDGDNPPVDVTCFADTSRSKLQDIPGATITGAGYMETSFEKALFDLWGIDGLAITIAKKRLAGELAFVAKVSSGTYNMQAVRGQPWGFTLAAETTGGLFGNGRLLHVGTAVAVTGTGAVQTMRAISTGRRAIATLHVSAMTGTTPSIVVIIESAALVGFGSPTTRATFATVNTASGIDGQVLPIAGPITDTFWRARWTVAGTLPVFDFAVGLGFEEGI